MLSMQNAIRKTRFVTINKVMDKFMNERISNTSGMLDSLSDTIIISTE